MFTYQGTPCLRGHSGLRYKDGHCVECVKARSRQTYAERRTRDLNWTRGKTFQGTPCKFGHSGIRYVTAGNCVECTRLANQSPEYKKTSRTYDKSDQRRFAKYRIDAKRRGYVFLLTREEFFTLIKNSCYWCGGEGGGVDRINNAEGYTVENAVPSCGLCNRIKSNLTAEEFLAHIARIYEHSC